MCLLSVCLSLWACLSLIFTVAMKVPVFLPVCLSSVCFCSSLLPAYTQSVLCICPAVASLLAIFTSYVNRSRAAALNLVLGRGNGKPEESGRRSGNVEKWLELNENTEVKSIFMQQVQQQKQTAVSMSEPIRNQRCELSHSACWNTAVTYISLTRTQI